MDTIFMNYENSKTSETHVLILKVTDKLDLRRGEKMLLYQTLATMKNIKNLYNLRDKVIKLYNDYAKIISKAMYKAKQGTRLKILIQKEMLQSPCKSNGR